MKKETIALAHPDLIDVFDLSKQHLLSLVFAKTASPYYRLAVNVATGACLYREHQLDKATVHVCGFARTPEDAARASSVIGYVQGWASTQIFVGGRLLTKNAYMVQETLRCYQDAGACDNSQAHCFQISTNVMRHRQVQGGGGLNIRISHYEGPAPAPEPAVFVDQYLMPCKRAMRPGMLDHDHPATLEQQLQAQAVAQETAWCPYFDARHFKKLTPEPSNT